MSGAGLDEAGVGLRQFLMRTSGLRASSLFGRRSLGAFARTVIVGWIRLHLGPRARTAHCFDDLMPKKS